MKELREAEDQFAQVGSRKDPQPTDLQRQYILVLPINALGDYVELNATDISFNNMDWTYPDVVLTTLSDPVAVKLDLGPNNNSDTAATGMICYADI